MSGYFGGEIDARRVHVLQEVYSTWHYFQYIQSTQVPLQYNKKAQTFEGDINGDGAEQWCVVPRKGGAGERVKNNSDICMGGSKACNIVEVGYDSDEDDDGDNAIFGTIASSDPCQICSIFNMCTHMFSCSCRQYQAGKMCMHILIVGFSTGRSDPIKTYNLYEYQREVPMDTLPITGRPEMEVDVTTPTEEEVVVQPPDDTGENNVMLTQRVKMWKKKHLDKAEQIYNGIAAFLGCNFNFEEGEAEMLAMDQLEDASAVFERDIVSVREQLVKSRVNFDVAKRDHFGSTKRFEKQLSFPKKRVNRIHQKRSTNLRQFTFFDQERVAREWLIRTKATSHMSNSSSLQGVHGQFQIGIPSTGIGHNSLVSLSSSSAHSLESPNALSEKYLASVPTASPIVQEIEMVSFDEVVPLCQSWLPSLLTDRLNIVPSESRMKYEDIVGPRSAYGREQRYSRKDLEKIQHKKFNINLALSDIVTLKDKAWLNDNVIDYWGGTINANASGEPTVHECGWYSTMVKRRRVSKRYNLRNITRFFDEQFEQPLVFHCSRYANLHGYIIRLSEQC